MFSKYKSLLFNAYTGINMKKEPMTRTTPAVKKCLASVLAVAALVFLILAAGCTTGRPAPAPATTIPVTTAQVPVTAAVTTPAITPAVMTPDPDAVDKAFADAAEICYGKTPVITNITTQLEFATCMGNTPLPLGNCARNFRYYALKHTNEDSSSAGFVRETENLRLAREAFLRGEGFDGVRQEYVPCGNATLIRTSILT